MSDKLDIQALFESEVSTYTTDKVVEVRYTKRHDPVKIRIRLRFAGLLVKQLISLVLRPLVIDVQRALRSIDSHEAFLAYVAKLPQEDSIPTYDVHALKAGHKPEAPKTATEVMTDIDSLDSDQRALLLEQLLSEAEELETEEEETE